MIFKLIIEKVVLLIVIKIIKVLVDYGYYYDYVILELVFVFSIKLRGDVELKIV